MRKRLICFVAACVLSLSCTAYAATNWVYVARSYNNDATFYIDTETIRKNGDYITFWELEVYDREQDFAIVTGVKKSMAKLEAKWTSPRQYQELEYYLYDAQNHELWYDNYDGYGSGFLGVNSGSVIDMEINMALRYAK